jgi:hypothetical protein
MKRFSSAVSKERSQIKVKPYAVEGLKVKVCKDVLGNWGSNIDPYFVIKSLRHDAKVEDYFDLFHIAKDELKHIETIKTTNRDSDNGRFMREVVFIQTRLREYINDMIIYGLQKGYLAKKPPKTKEETKVEESTTVEA